MSVNHLRITGIIRYAPEFDEQAPRRIKFTIRAHDERTGRHTSLKCEWDDPPERYWSDDRIKEGSLVLVEGPVFSSTSIRDTDLENRTAYCYITHFYIYSTKEEFENMKKNAVDKGRTY